MSGHWRTVGTFSKRGYNYALQQKYIPEQDKRKPPGEREYVPTDEHREIKVRELTNE